MSTPFGRNTLSSATPATGLEASTTKPLPLPRVETLTLLPAGDVLPVFVFFGGELIAKFFGELILCGGEASLASAPLLAVASVSSGSLPR